MWSLVPGICVCCMCVLAQCMFGMETYTTGYFVIQSKDTSPPGQSLFLDTLPCNMSVPVSISVLFLEPLMLRSLMTPNHVKLGNM